jgi:hypothetical protein
MVVDRAVLLRLRRRRPRSQGRRSARREYDIVTATLQGPRGGDQRMKVPRARDSREQEAHLGPPSPALGLAGAVDGGRMSLLDGDGIRDATQADTQPPADRPRSTFMAGGRPVRADPPRTAGSPSLSVGSLMVRSRSGWASPARRTLVVLGVIGDRQIPRRAEQSSSGANDGRLLLGFRDVPMHSLAEPLAGLPKVELSRRRPECRSDRLGPIEPR